MKTTTHFQYNRKQYLIKNLSTTSFQLCNVAGYAVVSVTYNILRFPFKVFYAIFCLFIVKMEESEVEKPICQVLYRQSSLETRLSPVHLSEESSESSDDELKDLASAPRIVDVKMKTPAPNFNQESEKVLQDVKTEEKREEDDGRDDKATAVYLMKSK
jgi:hypothetical protein